MLFFSIYKAVRKVIKAKNIRGMQKIFTSIPSRESVKSVNTQSEIPIQEIRILNKEKD